MAARNRKLTIADPARLRRVLETFSALDDIRWEDPRNYNPLNYCCKDLAPDEQLLTHWLCYIADRQTPFRRIWDVGAYVLSDLVLAYTRSPQREVREVLSGCIKRGEDGRLRLECQLRDRNEVLQRHGFRGPTVPFTSRYMPEDLVLVYRTLAILDIAAGRSLARFIADAADRGENQRDSIRCIAAALDELTYAAGGTVSTGEFDGTMDRMEESLRSFVVPGETTARLTGRKRLWCSLRDYLKSPEFNPVLVHALKAVGVDDAHRWDRNSPPLKEALSGLELPGDVWNNSPVFRRGLFSPYLRDEPRSWDMTQAIRYVYELLKASEDLRFYPEQLDVSFDFVPRMCEQQNCDICLFGAGIGGMCHRQPGQLCTVVLASCGYRHPCSSEGCLLSEDAVRGYCASSLA